MCSDFYRRGIQYDAQHAHLKADVNFYRGIARQAGGPILELACGTGRISIPLARDGYEVVGIDLEESMLAVARDKAVANSEFIQADMRDFELGRKFQLVLLAFNAVGHLYDRGQVERCFHCVKAHMNDDGLFVLSFFNPRLELLVRQPEDETEVSRYADPESENEVVVTERVTYDKARQIVSTIWHYAIGDDEFENRFRLRIFYPQELEALLHYAGFNVRDCYGDFDGSPFDSNSPHQIYVATA